jgi:predicted MFS family arabinose efflux permease
VLQYLNMAENSQKPGGTTVSPGILSSQYRPALLICISTFFFWAALYLYVPILPVYAQSLGASLSGVGIIVATYAMPQVALRIPMGIWSDYLGRRKPLVIMGFCMVLLGPIGMGLAPNPLILGLSRAVVGIGAATWAMFSVFLVSFYPAEKTAQMVGALNFINNAALVVSTLGGGLIADAWGRQFSFFGAAILAFIGMTIIFFAREKRALKRTPVSLNDFKQVARRPLLIVVSIIGVLVFFVQYTGVWSFVPVYAGRLGASGTALGVLTMLSTAAAMVGSIAVIPVFNRRGHSFSILVAALILAITSVAVPFTHSLAILDIIQAGNGFARGMLSTQLMTLSILEAPPRLRATAMSFYQAIYAIGMLSGPIVSGFLANNYGLSMAFYVSAGLCLVVLSMAYLPALPKRKVTTPSISTP